MSKKKVKAYSEAYRKEAVRLANQPDSKATDVAKELGIHVNQIYNWRNQFNKLSKGQFKKHEGVDYSKEETDEIRRLKKEFNITMVCRLLKVSRSGFYAWYKRPVSERSQRRQRVSEAVEASYFEFKRRYGARRIVVELNEQGVSCSLNHVAMLLKEKELRERIGKGFRYCAKIEAKTNVSENILKREFDADKPNQKWVSDITYIRVGRVWLYLAVVLDLFSRKVIGWALENHMREELILEAFKMAVSQRKLEKGMLLHSDRGVQYRGNEYQDALEANEIQCSMSRKGNCWESLPHEVPWVQCSDEIIF